MLDSPYNMINLQSPAKSAQFLDEGMLFWLVFSIY